MDASNAAVALREALPEGLQVSRGIKRLGSKHMYVPRIRALWYSSSAQSVPLRVNAPTYLAGAGTRDARAGQARPVPPGSASLEERHLQGRLRDAARRICVRHGDAHAGQGAQWGGMRRKELGRAASAFRAKNQVVCVCRGGVRYVGSQHLAHACGIGPGCLYCSQKRLGTRVHRGGRRRRPCAA